MRTSTGYKVLKLNFILHKFIFFGGVCLLPVFGEAGNLSTPFESESTAVLPAKIRSPRVKLISGAVESSFDQDGNLNGLGNSMNKRVTWGDVINNQTTETKKNLVRGALQDAGINENTTVGSTTGFVSTDLQIQVPVMSIGLSENWTLALAVPFYKVHVNASTGFVKSAEGQKFADSIGKDSPLNATEAAKNLTDPINKKALELGYKPIESEDFTALGDIKLVNKYRYFESENDTVTFKNELTLATGRAPQADKIVDVPTGDGQNDISGYAIWDHRLSGEASSKPYGVSVATGVNVQLPDRIERRIPKKTGDPLSDNSEVVERDLGDQFLLSASLFYGSGAGGFYSNLGVQYQYMQASTFRGTKYLAEQYSWLENFYPEQSLTTAVLGFGYSTIGDFRKGKFALPLQANLGLGYPLSGKSASAASLAMGELVIFF